MHSQRKKAPRLTQSHKNARLRFARSHHDDGGKWRDVIFSDENKWSLDGPDGISRYWHDLRKEQQWLSTRGFGGGSVMAWIGVSYKRKIDLVIMKGM